MSWLNNVSSVCCGGPTRRDDVLRKSDCYTCAQPAVYTVRAQQHTTSADDDPPPPRHHRHRHACRHAYPLETHTSHQATHETRLSRRRRKAATPIRGNGSSYREHITARSLRRVTTTPKKSAAAEFFFARTLCERPVDANGLAKQRLAVHARNGVLCLLLSLILN